MDTIDPKLVKMIIEKVEAQTEGVIMNIGQKIVSEEKIFEAHQKKQRQQLTGAQGTNYVLDEVKKLDEGAFKSFSEGDKTNMMKLFEIYSREYKEGKGDFMRQDVP